MAWLESHQSLGSHRKLLKLRSLLKITKAQAVGHLHYLWWWCLDNAPEDGSLSGVDAAVVAEAADWDGNPEEFLTALVTAEFVDVDPQSRNIRVHDWQDYGGRLQEVRRKDRERKAEVRRKSAGSPEEISRTLQYPTVQYPTEEERGNHPPPSLTVEIPSWEEFWTFCQVRAPVPEFYARDKFLAAEQKNWRGCENWKAYATRIPDWWRRDGMPSAEGRKPTRPGKIAV